MRQSEIPGLHKRLSAYDNPALFAQLHQIEILATLPGRIPVIVYSSMNAMVDVRLVVLEGALLLVAEAAVLWFALRLFRREQILTR